MGGFARPGEREAFPAPAARLPQRHCCEKSFAEGSPKSFAAPGMRSAMHGRHSFDFTAKGMHRIGKVFNY